MGTSQEECSADDVSRLPRSGHLTIEEVGRLAGVSRNTVSLALANSPRVRPETRERVLRVVDATGYRRNPAAAALAGGSARTVGIVEFGPPAYLSDRAYIGYLAGIEEATSANGYDLLLLSARRSPDAGWLLALARARRFDGVVLLGPETDRGAVAELLANGVPTVHVGRRVITGYDLPYVSPDYVHAGRLAVERLVVHGARHMIYATAVNQPESRADVLEGISYAVQQFARRGVAVSTAMVDLSATADTALVAAAHQPGLGVLVHGTRTSMAVWRALEAQGARPAIVAYDDEGWLDEALPGIDFLRPPKRLIGRQAALLTLDLIAKRGTATRHLAMPPEVSWARADGQHELAAIVQA